MAARDIRSVDFNAALDFDKQVILVRRKGKIGLRKYLEPTNWLKIRFKRAWSLKTI